MQLLYDDDFVESAVFARANSRQRGPPPLQIRRFHREREKLYSISDPDARNTAFFKCHLEWLREWGLEKLLLDVVNEFPLLETNLSALVFRKARAKNDEGAELYASAENGWAGVLALRVERFEAAKPFDGFLRHEFFHLHDMLNPEFGYSPQLHLPGQNAAQQRATRERYRLLWDITIAGRLAEKQDSVAKQKHRTVFDQVFSFWPESKRDQQFASLWENRAPRHAELLAIASDPREIKGSHQPQPGAPCPLCGFPTFDWAEGHRLPEPTIAAIRKEFPQWTAEQATCGRCLEIYRHIAVDSSIAA